MHLQFCFSCHLYFQHAPEQWHLTGMKIIITDWHLQKHCCWCVSFSTPLSSNSYTHLMVFQDFTIYLAFQTFCVGLSPTNWWFYLPCTQIDVLQNRYTNEFSFIKGAMGPISIHFYTWDSLITQIRYTVEWMPSHGSAIVFLLTFGSIPVWMTYCFKNEFSSLS